MGRVLPREKSGVDSVPWRMLTASRGVLKAAVALEGEGPEIEALAELAPADAAALSPTRVVAMAAMLEVLRNVRREGVMLFSFCISAKGHLFMEFAAIAMVRSDHSLSHGVVAWVMERRLPLALGVRRR